MLNTPSTTDLTLPEPVTAPLTAEASSLGASITTLPEGIEQTTVTLTGEPSSSDAYTISQLNVTISPDDKLAKIKKTAEQQALEILNSIVTMNEVGTDEKGNPIINDSSIIKEIKSIRNLPASIREDGVFVSNGPIIIFDENFRPDFRPGTVKFSGLGNNYKPSVVTSNDPKLTALELFALRICTIPLSLLSISDEEATFNNPNIVVGNLNNTETLGDTDETENV